jgi:hypothetical protein
MSLQMSHPQTSHPQTSHPMSLSISQSTPGHINPIQWHHAIAVSRQACGRVFADGGTPADAIVAFGLNAAADHELTWEKAVDCIAEELCAHPLPRAA